MVSIATAWNRFGLGARPSDRADADPRRWLTSQLDAWEPRPGPIAAHPDSRAAAAGLADYFEGRRRARAARRQGEQAPMAGPMRQEGRTLYRDAVAARAAVAIESDAPFVERLVHFWANHFAISAEKAQLVWLAGAFEFDAIRPHVLGSFGAMLRAVEMHPAMLLYLDQQRSIGPDSPLGRRVAERSERAAGLNENLAREILELHTMGVGSGYDQNDVTEFARALTGRTIAGIRSGPAGRVAAQRTEAGQVAFVERAHQPGVRTILGRRFDQPAAGQADAVLDMLATHPATARHIATKLARHFVADDPPPALVATLEQAFLRSGGDLPTVYRALIDAPEAWAGASAKFRTPWEWSIACWRGLGLNGGSAAQMAGLLDQLGQPAWRPGSPAGYDDIAGRWAGPDALMRRVEAAERLVSRAPDTIDARARSEALFPDALGTGTTTALARAESPKQALALMLVAPEFLRR